MESSSDEEENARPAKQAQAGIDFGKMNKEIAKM